jgi:hypothetical protein
MIVMSLLIWPCLKIEAASWADAQEPTNPGETKASLQARLIEARAKVRRIARPILDRLDVNPFLPESDVRAERIKAMQAELDHAVTTTEREAAERKLADYEKFQSPARLEELERHIVLARKNLEVAKNAHAACQSTRDKLGRLDNETVSSLITARQMGLELEAAALELQKAQFEVELAESNKNVLIEFDRERETRELKSEVEKAIADEMAATMVSEMAKNRLESLTKSVPDRLPAGLRPLHDQLRKLLQLDKEFREKLGKLKPESPDGPNALRALSAAMDAYEQQIAEAEQVEDQSSFSEFNTMIKFFTSQPRR